MDNEKLIKILKGQLRDLPKKSSKIVRIFLSSTFTGKFSSAMTLVWELLSTFNPHYLICSDTHAERDYLIEHIYPKLKEETKLRYGLDFQVRLRITTMALCTCSLKLLFDSRYLTWDGAFQAKLQIHTWQPPSASMRYASAKNCHVDLISS